MTKSKALVPVFESTIVDPRQVDALNALAAKRVPKNAISEHPGKGGKMFTYVKHTWVTETLQHGLGNAWSFDVQDFQVFSDSVAVRGTLTVLIPVNPAARQANDPPFITRTMTEIGIYELRNGVPIAATVASAASRCLCRCVMRMFGIGIEFYKTESDEITPAHAWTTLKEYAKKQGKEWTPEFEKTFIDTMKSKGITRDNIVDRYGDAYRILSELIGKVVKVEEMPE